MSLFFSGKQSQGQSGQPNQYPPSTPGPNQSVYPTLPGQPGQQQIQQYPFQQQHYNQQQGYIQPSSNAGPSYNAPYGQPQGQIGYGQTSYPNSQVAPYQHNPYIGPPIPAQPLDEIPPNESDKFGALSRAGNKVVRALESDVEISPDLVSKQPPPPDALYVPIPSPAFTPVRKNRHLPLPDALHQELNFKHLTAKMGLFEEIGRAWFTIDNKLFLWDYSDGQDFNRYDEQADTITAVGLVPVRRDVFIDALTHLLVICTSTKITVLGLGREADSKTINLFSTNLSVSSTTPITYVAGSTGGRVFLLGETKELFELEYSNDSSWFFGSGAKISLKNLSAGFLSNLLPTFLSSGTREGVESFVIDSERSYLFALRTHSEIEVFSFANDRFEQIAKYSQPRNQPKIVSIAVIGKHESQTKSLVAITATGVRYFFSVYPGRISTEYVQFTRNPPVGDLNLSGLSTYSSGTTLAVQPDISQGSQASRLHVFTPQIGFVSSKRDNERQKVNTLFQEYHTVLDLSADVWAIAEVSASNPSRTPLAYRAPATYGGAKVIALNPLVLEAVEEAREVLILTSVGLDHIVLPRPIDLLREAMVVNGDGYDKAVLLYGRTQVTAMAIAFGCNVDLNQTDNHNLIGTAILNGGEPIIESSPNSVSKCIRFSSKHDGLALTLSRYLRPIWSSPICFAASPNPQGPLALAVGVAELRDVQERLRKLQKFNNDVQYPLGRGEGDKKLAWDHEEMSFESLYKLIEYAIEAIAFIVLLQDFGLPAKVQAIPQLRQDFAQLTYEKLLTKAEGQAVANKLVQFLIETQLGTEGGVDSLTTRLQADCGAFCQPGDVVRYKAEESLRRAEREPNPAERRAYLDEALRMFNQSGSRLLEKDVGDGVKRVAQRFRELQYVPGAVEFPLTTARNIDPEDHAIAWEAAGSPQGDWRRQIWEQRQICYGFAIDALREFDDKWNQAIASTQPGASNAALDSAAARRDEAYRIAIDSNDELFHFRLYDWIIQSHRPEQFLDFDTEYVEIYLQRTNSDEPEHRDLLWKYYQRKEEYMKAAHALVDLATRESQLELEQRSFYLAQALTSARSAERITAEDVDFVNTVQERMDVSQVQLEVVRAIREHANMTEEEKEEVLANLVTRLVPLDSLFQDFARPYRLFEQILLILKTADTRLDDVLEAVWAHLLQNARGTPQWSAMRDVIVDLCRKYFPSEAAPLDIVIHAVYVSALPLASTSAQGWATEALLDGGIPIRECFEELSVLTESAESEEERQFYVEEAAAIAERWTDDRDAIPLADVEKYVTQQLLRLGGAGELDERQAQTKERLTRAKNAIRRW